MFAVNDYVFYVSTGVCKIIDTSISKLKGLEGQACFVLQPIADPGSRLFVPMAHDDQFDNMRPLLTKGEVHRMIEEMPTTESIWVANERDRSSGYFARIRSCDCREWVKVIRTLYLEKVRKKASGKTLTTTDSRIMAAAEKLLNEEFAFVLGIDPKDVPAYIRERIPEEAS